MTLKYVNILVNYTVFEYFHFNLLNISTLLHLTAKCLHCISRITRNLKSTCNMRFQSPINVGKIIYNNILWKKKIL